MPMCQVRIADDGEILVKSEMMFSGYHKDPEATAAMFTEDGWLKTGDLGSLDEEGFLRITGRKKEIIVLSTGKNIAPAAIENAVKESHLISHCFVYGDGRSYLVALITINSGEAGRNRAETEREIDAAVKRANSRFSRTEQIKKFLILNRDFSIERGEVTPTGKLRRNVIAETFRKELEKLYED
jgi:long-chain acyl-CoA synthetase